MQAAQRDDRYFLTVLDLSLICLFTCCSCVSMHALLYCKPVLCTTIHVVCSLSYTVIICYSCFTYLEFHFFMIVFKGNQCY